MFRRATFGLLAGLFIAVAVSGVAHGQLLPWKIGVDGSFRTELLFSNQVFLYRFIPGAASERFRMEFGPRVPLVSGTCEVSPVPKFSLRLAAAASVLEQHADLYHSMADPQSGSWDVLPRYRQWEAAGLLHLWTGNGYRFSLVGGFRRDDWRYSGDSTGTLEAGSHVRDEFSSNIPFLALQTAVYFPWWKARFEILGSPFMSKDVSANIREGSNLVNYDGDADSGGLIELDMEGTVAVGARTRLGLHFRYTYQELSGNAVRSANGTSTSHSLSVDENTVIMGVNVTYVF